MKNKLWLLYPVLALLLAFSLGVPANAADPVPLPHNFYGSLTIDTEPALAGRLVEASGEGVMTTAANPITTTDVGEYGGPGLTDPKLEVQGYIEEGTPIEFYIDGAPAQCREQGTETWLDSYPWHSSGLTELDLRVGEAPPDTTDPTVTITSTASDPTNISPIPVTATFSETVTGFVVGDITVGNGAAGNFVAVSGAVYTFDVTPTAEGEVTVDIAAGVAQDAAANPNEAATQFSITYTTAVLAVTIDTVTSPTNVATQTLTGTRSVGLIVVLTADTAATFGVMSYPTSTTWSAVVTLVEGSNGITATADTSTATATIVLDTTAPTVVSESPAAGATGAAVDTTVSATFSEDVTAVDLSGITIAVATGVSATLVEATDTITIAHDDFALSTSYTVTIPAGAVQDTAGNPNAEYIWSFTTVLSPPLLYIDLAMGWNTFSTPINLDPDYGTMGDLATLAGLNIEIAWYYNGVTQEWDQVLADYVMSACDAIYVSMVSAGTVPIYPDPEPSVSAKDVYPGWNLVGSAFINEAGELPVNQALISLYYVPGELLPWGYSQVISPALNQPGWTYPRGGTVVPNMLMGNGYWVTMDNADEYQGQTATPWEP